MRLSPESASESSAGGSVNEGVHGDVNGGVNEGVNEGVHGAAGANVEGRESGKSLFEPNLYKQHVEEARAWVEACRRAGKRNEQILDACGERGDLHFLLMSERARFAL